MTGGMIEPPDDAAASIPPANVLENPRVTDDEVISYAGNKNLSGEVTRIVANKKKFLKSLKDYLNSAELLATCQIEAWKRFGYDGVTVFADNSLEAEALGAKISYRDDAYPQIDQYCLNHPHQIY